MPTLTTVDEFKRFLGVSGTSEDNKLSDILDGVEWAAESFTHRKLARAAYTEYHSGHGRSLLILRHRPVVAISSVHVHATGYFGHGADAFAAEHAWTLGEDFVPQSLAEEEDNPGMLLALRGSDGDGRGIWPAGHGNIQVVYDGGYDTIPADVVLAVHQLGSAVRRESEKGGPVISETIGKYSYALLMHTKSSVVAVSEARALLSRYQEIAL